MRHFESLEFAIVRKRTVQERKVDGPSENERSRGKVDGSEVKWMIHQKVEGPSKSGRYHDVIDI